MNNKVVTAIKAVNDQFIFAGTKSNGIFLSSDSGNTWQKPSSDFDEFSINEIFFSDQKTLVGTNGNGLYISADTGKTWYQSSGGLTNNVILSIFGIGEGNYFVGSAGGGIFRSTNSGVDWIESNTGLRNLFVHDIQSTSNSKLFAATQAGGIYISTNNGSNWALSNNGLNKETIVKILKIDDRNLFAVADSGGIFYSSNSGIRWNRRDFLSTGATDLVKASDGRIFYSASNGIYVSIDGLGSFSKSQNGIGIKSVLDLEVTPSTGIYAGTRGSGIYKLIDSDSVYVPPSRSQESIRLLSNFPNPFNGITNIPFYVPSRTIPQFIIYDCVGRTVTIHSGEEYDRGTHILRINLSEQSSGVYYYTLKTGLFSQTRKMILIK
ncbi:MAG: T9SS type A sorting domain-containing protein [Melioribacteraceae bacterium]|nr:T9SS type A sorting domain-containing protein [Melioribacteraceae bacterium]MCF8264005.1 T9SS type A sorting domain-containing protein [Melioribacteraceae bacterium]MCF8412573.1 T9SS type A sorting domain-containing protein [Melioribacteraceae bacterium]MCF8431040.1 T9SS type A sorting domain-containing protein [Melioribacteraceae bacterium]